MEEHSQDESLERVLLIAKEDEVVLGSIRAIPNLRALRGEKGIWLRGIPMKKADARIAGLPCIGKFITNESGLLFPEGNLTPQGKLPKGDWLELYKFIQVEIPASALPGEGMTKGEFKLTASESDKSANALLLDWDLFSAYAETAPSIRMERWKYIAGKDGKVLVSGLPLPPLPGKAYVLEDGLAVPSGYELDYPFLKKGIAKKLSEAGKFVVLFEPDGNWHKIKKEYQKPVTRSAIRKTTEKR